MQDNSRTHCFCVPIHGEEEVDSLRSALRKGKSWLAPLYGVKNQTIVTL